MKTEQERVVVEKRTALVIGNGTYQSITPLKNPPNDARTMAFKLRALGFTVSSRINATKKQMREAIQQFGSDIRGSGVGLFYYAGHGVQYNGRNFLVPVNAEIASEGDVEDEAVSVDQILSRMGDAGNRMNIVILDACRNNPFGSFRSVTRGLSQMIAPSGTFIAYATAPGSVAEDGAGANGIYTQALLKEIAVPGVQLEDVFKNVLSEVKRVTRNKQIPWTSSSVEGKFFFVGPSADGGTPVSVKQKDFTLSDLNEAAKREETSKIEWAQTLEKMKTAFNEVIAYEKRDVSPEFKSMAWSRLIAAYPDDDPYSTADDSMRTTGRSRFMFWNGLRSGSGASAAGTLPVKGLVAYYPFNGNARDESGNGFDGTVNGAMPAPDRFGRINCAYRFAGCSSIRIPEVLSDTCSAFTVAAWVTKDFLDRSNHLVFIKGSARGEASMGNVDGKIGFGVNLRSAGFPGRDQTWYSANAPDTLRPGMFYFLVGRYVKGEKVEFMVNGVSAASVKLPNLNLSVDSRTYSALGIHSQLNFERQYCWNGVIDDFRIYSRALSDEEVSLLYRESANGPGLVAYYPFNGSAFDASGNGFNGIVHGATLVPDRYGNPNSAYSFDGRNSFIDLGVILDSVFSAPVAKFSVSGWACTRSGGTQYGGGGCIITKSGGGDAGPYQWSITHFSGNVLLAAAFSEPSGKYQFVEKSNSPAPMNQWFHFAYVFDGSLPEVDRVRIYLGGKRSDERMVIHRGMLGTTTAQTGAHLCIGATLPSLTQAGNFYNGAVDDIRIFNRALSDTDVQALLADTQ